METDDNLKINYEKCLFLDIETSKIKCDNNEEIQAVYLTNVLLVDTVKHCIIDSKFFRTLGDTIEYLNDITLFEQLICFSHNLDYELFHILRETQGNGILGTRTDIYNMVQGNSIFRDKNAPLSVWLEEIPNVNFRDSLALFNKSVKVLGNDLNLPKLEYDYKTERTCNSELTQLDYDYNERDNIIVAYSLFKRWNERGETLETTPLTFTASTKKDRHNFIKDNFGKGELKALNIDNSNVYENFDFYRMCLESYQGGLTTANKNFFNKKIENKIMSIDITSSYPYQMCSRRFPLYDKRTVNHFKGDKADTFYSEILHGIDFQDLAIKTPIRGYFATVEIINLEIKNDNYLLPLSSSNTLYIEGETLINGKVYKANKIVMSLDHITLSWINRCYYYDDIICKELITTTKDRYLRCGELSFIMNNFRIKQTMKGVKGQEINYALAKVNCNNNYGIKVQKPLKDRYDIVNGEVIKLEYKDNFNLNLSQEEIYNNFIDLKHQQHFKNLTGKNFDIFNDGVTVTSTARYMLLDMMIRLTDEKGCKVVYADTDSLKFICDDIKSLQQFVLVVNGEITTKNKSLYRFKEYKELFNVPNDEYEKLCELGTWDIENKDIDDQGNIKPYLYFKTLGAKKYVYVDSSGIHTTIAGCSKKVSETMEIYASKNNISLINTADKLFNTGVMFDVTCSGRTVSSRENREYEYIQTFTKNGLSLFSNGGIIINDTSYTLNLSKSDENVLELNRVSDVVSVINKDGVLMPYNEYKGV